MLVIDKVWIVVAAAVCLLSPPYFPAVYPSLHRLASYQQGPVSVLMIKDAPIRITVVQALFFLLVLLEVFHPELKDGDAEIYLKEESAIGEDVAPAIN